MDGQDNVWVRHKGSLVKVPIENVRLATEEGALIGPPEEIVERLQRMRAGGVEYVLLIDITGSRESLRLFRDEVMPALV